MDQAPDLALAARISPGTHRPGRGPLLISLVLHSLIVICAIFWVVRLNNPSGERRITFQGGGGGGKSRSAGAETERRMQLARQPLQLASAAQRLVVDAPRPQVSLPDLPALKNNPIPQLNSLAPQAPGASLGVGTGTGGGIGGGIGVGSGISTVNFFGLRTKVRSVVFVVDVSGSMVQGEKRASYAALERDIIKNIMSLDPRTDFDLIVFAGMTATFKIKMTAASETAKEDAVSWLKEHSPALRPQLGGGTRSDLSLSAAFALKPEAVIFFSDGMPVPVSPASVLTLVGQLQGALAKRIVIHAFAYYADDGKEFMEALAEQNGGEYRDVPSLPGSAVTPPVPR